MIVTFYSFKGGVGRSMALANIPEWLFLNGARVVMIDWDLEAPGLENYFCRSDDQVQAVRAKPGLMDLLDQYKQHFRNELSALRNREQACDAACARLGTLSEYLHPVVESGPAGRLLLMSAGSRVPARHPRRSRQEVEKERGKALTAEEYIAMLDDAEIATDAVGPVTRTFPEYARNVQDFDWNEFLDTYRGERFFGWLKRKLIPEPGPAEDGLADIVLIDSRTGITEMGGVCTRLMADLVVAFCASNRQNLEGTVQMAQSFRRPEILQKRGKVPEVMLIPSRVEDRAESDDLQVFHALFERMERQFPTGIFQFGTETLQQPATGPPRPASPEPKYSFWKLYIPYFPKLSYQEALTFPLERGTAQVAPLPDVQKVYRKLGAHIAVHAPVTSAVRSKLAPALKQEVPELLERLALLYLVSEGKSDAQELKRRLEGTGLSMYPDIDHRTDSPAERMTALRILRQVKAAIVLLTPGAKQCFSLRQEIRWARQQGKCVFFVTRSAEDTWSRFGTEKSRIDAVVEIESAAEDTWSRFGTFYHLERDWERLLADVQGPCLTLRAPNMAPPLPDQFAGRTRELGQLRTYLLEAASSPGVSDVACTDLRKSERRSSLRLSATMSRCRTHIPTVSCGSRCAIRTVFSVS